MSQKTALIIALESWGVNFLSKHHYALTLVKLGYEVYYLGPDRVVNDVETPAGIHLIGDPKRPPGVNRLPAIVRDRVYRNSARSILDETGKLDLVINFDPYRFSDLTSFKAKRSVYICADLHSSGIEKSIAESSDAFYAVSQALLDLPKFRAIQGEVLGHALSDSFADAGFENVESNTVSRVGYAGNVLSKFLDRELFLKTIEAFPNISFEIFGPYKKSNIAAQAEGDDFVEQLQKLPNVCLHGSKSTDDLIGAYQSIDMFWLCYDTQQYKVEASNSHKVLEYLVTGRPVVSTQIDEYRKEEGMLRMASAPDDFVNVFSDAIENYPRYVTFQRQQMRREFALARTYMAKTKILLGHSQ